MHNGGQDVVVGYSYLPQQFADADDILAKIKTVVERGDYTLGAELAVFEAEAAARCGVSHAIGVNSGTDALFLSLKALGIEGEVITTPYSFFASTAAIVNAGAYPVYSDVGYDFNLNPDAIAAAVTPRTEAIMPVHWAGRPCDMDAIEAIAKRHNLAVIEDCAHAFGAKYNGEPCGSLGNVGTFSLHPLKTLNVWGDGGFIATDNGGLADRLRRMRNHGLLNRDTCGEWAYNSRLDTIQAVVARHVLGKIDKVIHRRREIAARLDENLAYVGGVAWEPMRDCAYSTYYLYTFRAESRDDLVETLKRGGVDAKVHYPVPLHLQPAAERLGYCKGDFPVAEQLARETVSLPAHEFVTDRDADYISGLVASFYGAESRVAAGVVAAALPA